MHALTNFTASVITLNESLQKEGKSWRRTHMNAEVLRPQ